MIIDEITIGFVVQKFDTDTGEYIRQDFIAEDGVTYETINGEPLDPDELPLSVLDTPYLPFDMVQP